MDKGWSRYFINLLESAGIRSHLALLPHPALGWGMQKVCDNFFKKTERKKGRRRGERRGEERRGERSNLIVWRLHMVLWLFGSPRLAASRLRPFTASNRWQTSLSSLHPPLNIHQHHPPHPFIHTLNLVRRIIEGANNEGAWRGVGEGKGGVEGGCQVTRRKHYQTRLEL